SVEARRARSAVRNLARAGLADARRARADRVGLASGAQARTDAWIRRAPSVDVWPAERNSPGRPAAGGDRIAAAPVEALSTRAPALLSGDRGAGVPPSGPSRPHDRRRT